jgi:hypothetical protein
MQAIALGDAQHVESAKLAVIMVAVFVVTFWKALLRLLVALVAIAFVVVVGAGVVMLMQR